MATHKQIYLALHEGKRVKSLSWKETTWIESTHGLIFDEEGMYQCELEKLFTRFGTNLKNWVIL